MSLKKSISTIVSAGLTVPMGCSLLPGNNQTGLASANDKSYSLAVYTTTTPFYAETDNLEQETESVYFALSSDGKNYEVLNNNGGVVFAKKGSCRLKQPRIERDGDKYVICALDYNGNNVHVFNSSDGVFYIEQDMVKDKSLVNDIDSLAMDEVSGFPDDDNISLGNAIPLTKEEYDYIYSKLGNVINTGLESVQSFVTTVGNALTERDIEKAVPTINALYNDGSKQSFKVDWTGAMKNVDFSKEGTYIIAGNVVQKKYINKLKELNNSVLSEDDPDNKNEEFPSNYDPDTDTIYYDETKFVEGMADPHIFRDEITGYYYMTGSYFPQDGDAIDEKDRTNSYDRITLRRGKTLEELQTRQGNQVTIWKVGNQNWYDGKNDTEGSKGYSFIWAPEIHRVGYVDADNPGWWVIYFTESHGGGEMDIYCHCIVLPGDMDPYETGLKSSSEASAWKDYKMQIAPDDDTKPVDNKSVKPFEANFCLDMTYFKDEVNGQYYVIWAATPTGKSDLYIAKVSEEEPWQLTSGCIRLTTPEYGWEKIRFAVNEGPTVLQKNGKLFMCFSNSGTGSEYSIGMMTADCGADLLDYDNWTKIPYPMLTSRDVNGEEGPGHNSFTVDEDGNTIFVYHARPTTHNYRCCSYNPLTGRNQYNEQPLSDPCRHARLKRVHWSFDGTPILKMTYDNELTEACKTVYTTVQVKSVVNQTGNAAGSDG